MKMIRIHRLLGLSGLFCAGAVSAAQPLALAPTLGNGMVLQRDQPITIWGTAAPDASVRVRFGGERVETTAAAGTWQVQLKPRPASATGATLEVTAGEDTLVLSDLHIGDLWFCAGQSNMYQRVDPDRITKEVTNPQIRFLNEVWTMICGMECRCIAGHRWFARRRSSSSKIFAWRAAGVS